MFKSIKSKFIFFSIFLIFMTAVIPMYFLVRQLRENFKERSIVMLDTTLDIVRYGLKFAMMTGHPEDIQNMIDEISKKSGIYRIRIFNSKGKIKFATNHEEINENLTVVAPHHYDYTKSEGKVISLETGENIYSTSEPIFSEKPCQSCHEEKGMIAYLDIDSNLTSSESKFYTGSVHMIFLGWAVILILLAGLYFIFNKFINSPLKRLVFALSDVESGNLNVSLDVKENDEIGTVNKHFNAMTSKLRTSREQIDQMHLEELQRLNRLKTLGELTSQTAHEVNNHIAIIMSRADYLSMETTKVPALKKYAEDLHVLLDQSSKISEITGNILKYSKKKSVELKEINLVDVVNEFVMVYEPLLLKQNILLRTDFKLEKAFTIGDSVQINQILTNLISNAADAIVDDGIITISLSASNDERINLAVTDNGPGIDKEREKEIFSPFFTTKNTQNNTGLGLYIVKKICENLNAQIKCNSEQGTGTTFIISFNFIQR